MLGIYSKKKAHNTRLVIFILTEIVDSLIRLDVDVDLVGVEIGIDLYASLDFFL